MTPKTHRSETVDRSVTVRLPAPEAWALFTEHLSQWWPMTSHSCSRDPRAIVSFEPRVGGDVVETTPDGVRHAWGTLTAWDPPRAFEMKWHPNNAAEQATHLRVSFSVRPDGTEIRVLHDGWAARGALSERVRDEYDRGWPLVLREFANAATQQARDA